MACCGKARRLKKLREKRKKDLARARAKKKRKEDGNTKE